MLWIGHVALAPAPAMAPTQPPTVGKARRRRTSTLRRTRPTPQVVVVRRPGLRPYQQLAEEFRGHVRAVVELRGARRKGKAALLSWLRGRQPDLVLAVGQLAYEQLRELRGVPLLYTYVYHRQRLDHHGIHVRIPPHRGLSALLLARPKAKRIALLCSPTTRWLATAAQAQAKRRGIRLDVIVAASPARAISRLHYLPKGIQGLWLPADLEVLSPQVLQVAIGIQFRRRIPLLAASRQHVSAGALVALDYSPTQLGQRSARLANQLLQPRRKRRRRRRGSLRISRGPFGKTTPRLTLNVQTARRIGVDAKALRALASEVVH